MKCYINKMLWWDWINIIIFKPLYRYLLNWNYNITILLGFSFIGIVGFWSVDTKNMKMKRVASQGRRQVKSIGYLNQGVKEKKIAGYYEFSRSDSMEISTFNFFTIWLLKRWSGIYLSQSYVRQENELILSIVENRSYFIYRNI